MDDERFIYPQTYFLAGDGYSFRITSLCEFLLESEIDCRIVQGEPDHERYGRDVTFRFESKSNLVAFKLRFNGTLI